MFKKTAAIFIAASLMLGAFSGCSLPATSLGNIAGQDEAESRTEPAVYIETLEAKVKPGAESLPAPHYGADDGTGNSTGTTHTPELETPPEDETPSEYKGQKALAYVSNYVNVRSGPTTEDEVVGKIYNFCAADILDEVDGEDGKWFMISSGSVVGYIKSEFFLTGEEAEAMREEVGVLMGTVMEDYLRVRSEPDLNNPDNVFTFYERGTQVYIDELTDDGWAKITSDDASTGYVYADCLDIERVFKTAISIEEEQAEIARRLAAEEAARKAQEEYEAALRAQEEAAKAAELARQQEEWARQQQAAAAAAAAAAAEQERARQEAAAAAAAAAAANAASSNASNDALAAQRNAVVQYALQFVGNPYVHGGRSLVTGTDCSGFTSLVYANFGYSLSYTPEGQSGQGVRVDLNDLRPGDLLFYSNSYKYLGHVAMYIGNGQIVHAGTEATGICIWNAYYRNPLFANRIIN
ncbi:MAG: C40 family peptidase [Lachnospiraceae bacterium]|nr:C40 family peptidase [Lachnospiraceae bacterium]